MNVNLRYCKKCQSPYDIGTQYDLCPECRNKLKEEERGKWKNYQKKNLKN